jgi:hypothetical protein
MSAEEMRDFCLSVSRFGLRVQVRLKNGSEILVGKVREVEADQFQLETQSEVQKLRFAWVARIANS